MRHKSIGSTRACFSRPAFLAAAIAGALSIGIGAVTPAYAEEEAAKAEKIKVLGSHTLTVPAEFKRAEKASRIIEHEFKVTLGEQSARLTMMTAGGGVEANIKRWQGQFAGGAEEDQKSEKMEIGDLEVHIVDCSGTYAERMGGGPFFGGKTVQRKDYAMAGAIIVNDQGRQYFVKMIGPADLIKASRKKFVSMIKTIGE